jgi:hypothetical protein
VTFEAFRRRLSSEDKKPAADARRDRISRLAANEGNETR